jgi:hypothetical protein
MLSIGTPLIALFVEAGKSLLMTVLEPDNGR